MCCPGCEAVAQTIVDKVQKHPTNPGKLTLADLAAYQPKKLYYHLFPKTLLRWAVRLMPLLRRDPRKFGRNGDIDLVDLVSAGDYPACTG